jgi:hypothetical protein
MLNDWKAKVKGAQAFIYTGLYMGFWRSIPALPSGLSAKGAIA